MCHGRAHLSDLHLPFRGITEPPSVPGQGVMAEVGEKIMMLLEWVPWQFFLLRLHEMAAGEGEGRRGGEEGTGVASALVSIGNC